jgi:hypothetical protein
MISAPLGKMVQGVPAVRRMARDLLVNRAFGAWTPWKAETLRHFVKFFTQLGCDHRISASNLTPQSIIGSVIIDGKLRQT